ncbi:hypothetical protein HN784_01595 [bacterium]|jgi:histidinol phosphatase-like enzyme|nr:hypothetical protein [bacterium]MBT4250956.1 hypothetical protein [bacterium]MBT4597856.1 hypothetical protein [bacterium]MBT6753952.1 hypothetical protein [bacterium]MBT7037381.1 hypothetical protein [bacterium]
MEKISQSNDDKIDNKKKSITKEQKTKVLIIAASVCLVAGVAGVGIAKASSKGDRHEAFAERFAQRFNVNKEDVKKVFIQHKAEVREERRTAIRKRHEDELNQAVASGKITIAQKISILKRVEEIQAIRKENIEEGREFRKERREESQKHREEMEEWASDNGIPKGLIGHHGPHMRKK